MIVPSKCKKQLPTNQRKIIRVSFKLRKHTKACNERSRNYFYQLRLLSRRIGAEIAPGLMGPLLPEDCLET